MSSGKSWSDEDITQLMRLKDIYHDWDYIGKMLNRTPHACRIKHNRLTASKRFQNNNKKWAIEDDRLLIRLLNTGMSLKKVAKRLRRTTGGTKFRADKIAPTGKWRKKPIVKRNKIAPAFLQGVNASPTTAERLDKQESGLREIVGVHQEPPVDKRVHPPMGPRQDPSDDLNASNIFDYVKQLESENQELRNTIKEIKKMVSA